MRYCGIDVDCLGLTSGQAYDTIFANFASEICDLQEATDGLEGIDHVSFTSSTGTPSSQPNQPCETDTYTFWGDVSETVNLGTFTVSNPCTSSEYADVAWVDLYNGDDSTGQAGRFDLPFLTISAALVASDYVFLRQGEYTEFFEMKDGMIMYSEPGVIFTDGGLVFSSEVATGAFLGYARFTGTSIPVRLITGGTLRFECDYVDNTSSAFYTAGSASLVAHMNYLRCEGEDAGFICSFRDDSQVKMYIKEFCEGYYSPYFLRGQNVSYFLGSVEINCPISKTLEGGIYGAIRKSVLNIDENDSGNIILKGDIECANTTIDSTDAGCVRYVQNTVADTVIDIEGDIIGGVEIGIYNGASGAYLDLTHKGNITSDVSPMTFQNNSIATVAIKLNFINSIIEGGASTIIGQGVTAYFKDCTFYNSANNGDVIDINDTGSNNTTLYMYNCIGEATGAGLFIADNMTGFTETYGATFTNANVALDGTVADTWGGFAVIAGVVTPKI
jgi:hypothetical protein